MQKYNITKDTIYKLYITDNLTMKEISERLGISVSQIYRYLTKFNIRKGKVLSQKAVERKLYEKYGVTNISKLDTIKAYKKQLSYNKYGVDSLFKTEQFKKKAKVTKILKYGDENYTNRQKAEQTCIEEYGVSNPSCLKAIKIKKQQTCQVHYGVDNPSKSAIIKDKKQQTTMHRYGVKSYMQIPELCQKIVTKGYETRKRNGTFTGKSKVIIEGKEVGCSSDEAAIYNHLKEVFKEVKFQYKSEFYPFSCDFYVPEIDTYIEYQGTWEHGQEAYIGTDQQLLKVQTWKAKKSKRYSNTINIWTKRDPLKRMTAKRNNLNWLEFFTLDEFLIWFNDLVG